MAEGRQAPVGMVALHFDVRIIQDGEATAAALELKDAPVTVVGTSKKHPKDEFDSFIGQALALARLFRELADGYERGAKQVMEAPSPSEGIARLNQAARDFLARSGVPVQELG